MFNTFEYENLPWKKYLAASLAIVLLIFVYNWISSPLIVSVSGVGEVQAPAETAVLTFSISKNADSATNATNLVKQSAQNIKNILYQNGVQDSDIYESQVTVVPATTILAGAPGFQATLSMGFKTYQINSLDSLTSTLYQNGAVVVSQPQLQVGKIEELEKQALDIAMKDAKRKANDVAWSNLKLFRKIVLIEQSETSNTSTVTTKANTISQVEDSISADMGIIKVNKIVLLSYKMW